MRSKQTGFTLIELLIVVAIIGIIAAIALPNLLNAIDRGKQKRTMADMRSIGTACEEYSIDSNNFYPVQTTQGPISGTISGVLEPTYIRVTPTNDGWNGAIQYGSDAPGPRYTIPSHAKDTSKNCNPPTTSNIHIRIVFHG